MNIVKKIHSEVKTDIVPMEIIRSVFHDKSEDARKGVLKRACQKGELIRVKSGLYLVGEEERRFGFNHFTLANFMVRPSYISLETALSSYGLIPEAVYTTTSVTTKKPLEHESQLGNFSFSHLKQDYFNFGFYSVKEGHCSYLIATPMKAVMDYIVIMKKKYQSVENIEEDLRFDWDEFASHKEFVNTEAIDRMLEKYKSHRLQVILKDMRRRL
jgi:predicted transcriptional regulator of viral defense system